MSVDVEVDGVLVDAGVAEVAVVGGAVAVVVWCRGRVDVDVWVVGFAMVDDAVDRGVRGDVLVSAGGVGRAELPVLTVRGEVDAVVREVLAAVVAVAALRLGGALVRVAVARVVALEGRVVGGRLAAGGGAEFVVMTTVGPAGLPPVRSSAVVVTSGPVGRDSVASLAPSTSMRGVPAGPPARLACPGAVPGDVAAGPSPSSDPERALSRDAVIPDTELAGCAVAIAGSPAGGAPAEADVGGVIVTTTAVTRAPASSTAPALTSARTDAALTRPPGRWARDQ